MSEEGTKSVHDFLKGPLYGLCDICKGDFLAHLNRAYAERNEARREYEGPMAEEITKLRSALTDALDWICLAPDDGQPLKFHELALSELRRKHGDLILNPPCLQWVSDSQDPGICNNCGAVGADHKKPRSVGGA